MYYFYTSLSEKRNGWKSAYEVKAAALTHKKRQYQAIDIAPLAKPQVAVQKQRSGWTFLFR